MKTQVITAPTSLPITYQQVNWHMRLPDMSDKLYVELTMQQAVDFAQSEMECSLMPTTLQTTHYQFPGGLPRLVLPLGPVQSITSITSNGNAFSSTNYVLEAIGNTDYVRFIVQPSTPVVITYVAGYSTIPTDIIRALLIQTSQFYEYREAVSLKQQYQVEMGLARIYCKYKRTSQVA